MFWRSIFFAFQLTKIAKEFRWFGKCNKGKMIDSLMGLEIKRHGLMYFMQLLGEKGGEKGVSSEVRVCV